MTDLRKAAEQALEALEQGYSSRLWPIQSINAIQALRQALAETDHFRDATKKIEPVAWMKEWEDGHINLWLYKPTMFYEGELQPLYTAPPKAAEWVGLSDEDIDLYALDIGVTANKAPPWLVTYARDIETKLREKNK